MAQLRFGGLEYQGNITLAVATTGSDAPSANRPARITRGDYSAFPFATIQAAIDALAPVIRYGGAATLAPTINVGAGNFAGFTVEGEVGSIGVRILGTRATATPATGSATGTATGGGLRTLTDSGATWTTDDLVGRYLSITSGPGAGQIWLIAANDATNIYLADPCSPLPGAGSVYVIQDLTTVITSASARATAILGASVGIYMLRNVTFFIRDLKIAAGVFGYYGAENTRAALQRVTSSGMSYGILEQDSGIVSWNQIGAFGAAVLGIGCYNVKNTFNGQRGWFARNCNIGIDLQLSVGGFLFGAYTRGGARGIRMLGCNNGGMKIYNPLIDGAATGVEVQAGTCGFLAIEVRNSTSGCFYLFMARLFFETSLVGAGNAGWGMYVNGAANHVQLTGITPTITGTLGEVTVDGVHDETWAALDAPGDYALDMATGARVVRE